jgi:hypothetical protein
MHFTLWPNAQSNTGVGGDLSREGFLAFVSSPVIAADKSTLEGWSPARFRENRRGLPFVEAVSALVLDYDRNSPHTDDLAAFWSFASGAIHTSFSHTPECPKHRVVLFLSRDVTADEHATLWRAMRDHAAAHGHELDEATKDASRLWYSPAHREGTPYEHRELTGVPLAVDAILAASPAVPVPVATAPAPRAAVSPSPNAHRKAAAAALGAAWPAKGTRHHAKTALAGALWRDRWAEEDALAFAREVYSHVESDGDNKLEAEIASTYARAPARKGEITGWRELGTLMDPGVVSAARDLLNGTKAMEARFAEVGARIAEAAAKPMAADGGLGFEYGAWETEPPPIEYLVQGVIPRGSVGMFYGRANALKTWILFSLVIAIASGKPWLGRFAVKMSKVGIVDFETGTGNVRRRLFMLRAGKNPNIGAKSFATLKPSQPEFWIALAAEGFEFVIIDSLRKANPGADENDSAEAIKPLELAAEFSERTGCAVYFIHHAKKDTSDGWPEFRGSGAIEDQVDCAFAVRKSDVSATKKTVDIRCDKPGDMPTPEPFSVEIDFDDVERAATLRHVVTAPAVDGATNASKGATTDSNRELAVKLLRGQPRGLPKSNLMDLLKGANDVRRETLALLETASVIVEYKEGKRVYVMLNPSIPH